MENWDDISLTDLNRRIHAEHETLRLDFLSALLALDWQKARVHFEQFRQAFGAHVQCEEAEVLPHLQAMLAARDGPREKWDAHLQGDHVILERSLTRIDATLQRLDGERTTHRDLAHELDTFVQLGRVLEHHHQREDRIIYPHLDEYLGKENRQHIRARLIQERPIFS